MPSFVPSHVFYHANCVDGLFAAHAVRQVHPGATFVPVQYGNPAPDVTGAAGVLVVDFCWPLDETLKMISQCEGRFLVIDQATPLRVR